MGQKSKPHPPPIDKSLELHVFDVLYKASISLLEDHSWIGSVSPTSNLITYEMEEFDTYDMSCVL